MNTAITAGVIAALAMTAASASAATGMIDFESIPGGETADKLPISNQYAASHGVTFSVSDGSPFELGMYNDPNGDGWIDNEGNHNVLHPDFNFGQYFARYPAAEVPGRYLIIDYSTPTAAVGFDLIDIDDNIAEYDIFFEEWQIRLFELDANEPFQTTVISNLDEDTGDTWPTHVQFSFETPRISRIEVEFTGPSGWPGLAFDNFTPTSVPAPGAAALLGLGGLAAVRRRRRA